jgi:beta-lactamase regulating signal transducer with metallopeptidase domain
MSVLNNIPFAIINNIGFSAILFLVYQLLKTLQEKEILPIKASHLFSMASIFQCMGMVQFIALLFYPKLGSEILNTSLNFVNTGIPSLFMQTPQAPIGWLSIIGLVYCIVLAGLIIKMAIQFYQLATLIKTSNYSDSPKYISFINSLPHASKGKKVKIGISPTIESPISFGWIEPIILLPIALVNQLTVKEIESIILHEWAHILRNDYLINIITSLVQVILFFNPFSYLLNKEISLQREIACDNFVIKSSVEKLDYLNAIYKIATGISNKNSPISNNWTMGILNIPNELLYRVKTLTKTKRFNFIHSAQIILATFIASLLFFIPFYNTPSKLVSKVQPKVSFVYIKVPSSVELNPNSVEFKKPRSVYTSTHKHKRLLEKNNEQNTVENTEENTAMVHWNDVARPSNLINKSYEEMVGKTMQWIKTRAVENQFASYQDKEDEVEYEVAEKLLMRAIFTNYQLKRELLNDRLTKAANEKEAMDYVVNSKEWEQMQQFEKWTAEFLKKHPLPEDNNTTSIAIVSSRLIVY